MVFYMVLAKIIIMSTDCNTSPNHICVLILHGIFHYTILNSVCTLDLFFINQLGIQPIY